MAGGRVGGRRIKDLCIDNGAEKQSCRFKKKVRLERIQEYLNHVQKYFESRSANTGNF